MSGTLDPDEFVERFLDDQQPPDPTPGRISDVPVLPAQIWRAWWQATATIDPVCVEASRDGFVFTPAEASALGMTRAQRRTAVRRGRWQASGWGFVSPVDVRRELSTQGEEFIARRRQHALAAAAASRRRPRDAIACRSAATLHGLPTFRVPESPELLLAQHDGGGRLGSGHLYAAACPASEVTTWFGRPVTTVARTLVDLGRHDRFDAIMAADAALREELTTVREINRALQTAVGWPGVRQARAVLALADPLAESPLESVTRLRMHDAGLPAPTLQRVIGGFRVDFYWPEYRFVLEADGRLKYDREGAGLDEKKREQALRRSPDVDRVERVIWDDVLRGWPQTLRILDSILR